MNAIMPQRLFAGKITDRIIAEKQGTIGWLTFNQPEKRNAVSVDMWEAIPVVLDAFESDPEIRVIVFKGAGGKAFVSGADISQFDAMRSGDGAVSHYEQVAERAQVRIYECDTPTIAMINGFCIGGGVNIALCCDLRITALDGRFGVPAVRLGLGYRLAALLRLVNTIGHAKARELFFTARQIGAEAAQQIGLVHAAVPEGELLPTVLEYCTTIADNAPLTIRASKRMMRAFLHPHPGVDMDAAGRWIRECFDSEDYAEGRRAFMEKRRPVFKGR